MKLHLVYADALCTAFECVEDLTLLELSQVNEPLEPLLGPKGYAQTVLLDLSQARYIDSAGIGWLVMCHKHCRDQGGHFIAHSPSPMAQHAFQVLDLFSVMTIVDDEGIARQLAQSFLH